MRRYYSGRSPSFKKHSSKWKNFSLISSCTLNYERSRKEAAVMEKNSSDRRFKREHGKYKCISPTSPSLKEMLGTTLSHFAP